LIVIDASVMLELLLNTPASASIGDRVFVEGESLHAPHLLDVEVAQVLRRHAAGGQIGAGRGLSALQDLADFPLIRHPHDLFLGRIRGLRHSVTAYDAVYLALAEALPAPLITRDRKLASATGHRAEVEVV
jgi:predicted nucleic acid-binding protein